jgi:hypothetical protein
MKHSAQEGSAPDTLDTKITIPITAVIDREFKRRGVFPELRLEMATKVINGATGKHLVSLERAREIAELVNQRHDKVKRTIETLGTKGVISHPQIEDGQKSANGVVEKIYQLGKRDSLIVVAHRLTRDDCKQSHLRLVAAPSVPGIAAERAAQRQGASA